MTSRLETTRPASRPWLSLAVLALLMGVALALRWRYVQEISLFVDEFVTAWAARSVVLRGLPIFPSGNFYPHGLPFTYLVAPFVAGGFAETVVRLPGLILGLLSLPVAYWVGRSLLSESAGLVAAAALAVDPEAIAWGSRARMYGLLQLLALLAFFFYYRGLAKDRPRDRVVAMALLALAILTHAEAIFLLPILGLATLAFWPWRRLLRWSVILPFGIGAAGALVYFLLAKFGQPGHLETLQDSRPYLNIGVETLLSGPQMFAPVFLRLYRLPFTLLALAGLFYLVPRRLDRRSPLTYCYIILALFAALLLLLAGATWQNERYFYIVLPLLFLVGGEVLDRLARSIPALAAGAPRALPALAPLLGLLAAILAGVAGSHHAYEQVWGYDRAFQVLRELYQPAAGDRLVTPMPSAAALYVGGADYFAIQQGYEEFVVPRPGDGRSVDLWTATPILTTTAAFDELLWTTPRVWLVTDSWRLQTRYSPEWIQTVADEMVKVYDERGVMIWRGQGRRATAKPEVRRERDTDLAGQMALAGFSLSAGRPRPGGELEVTLYWQAGEEPAPAYTAFVHLVAPDGSGVAGVDEPLLAGLYQPDLWPPGHTFADRHRLPLPAGLAPGRYRLDAGLYYPGRPDDPLREGDDNRVVLTYVTVGEPAAIPAPSEPAGVTFGQDVRLVGLDRAGAGQEIELDLHWQAARLMERDYQVFVHVVGPDGRIVAQDDQAPGGAFYPTSAWLPGDTLVSHHRLTLPDGARPGGYRLLVGLYDRATEQRLPAAEAGGGALGDAVDLGTTP